MIADGRGDGLSLVGYRGAGKSTVGRIVADRLGRPFLDLDAELVARLGRPIAEVFAEIGETGFRDEEARTLAESLARPGLVVATGGGAVLRESNRLALQAYGFVVWLAADAGALVERLRHHPDSRPPLTKLGLLEEVSAVLTAREPLYRAVADAEIPADGRAPEAVVDEVVRRFLDWSEGRGATR